MKTDNDIKHDRSSLCTVQFVILKQLWKVLQNVVKNLIGFQKSLKTDILLGVQYSLLVPLHRNTGENHQHAVGQDPDCPDPGANS